ncbi:MAG: hypothetical protein CBE00_11080 [Planctomycetaceae bacterium TMED240]|nr:hypothetical protein [Rhodopirellula sp.]OUX05304.1 MAG: hypothetical protein CBE00_11080 [Planctomycetaceae bacterium TMED240]
MRESCIAECTWTIRGLNSTQVGVTGPRQVAPSSSTYDLKTVGLVQVTELQHSERDSGVLGDRFPYVEYGAVVIVIIVAATGVAQNTLQRR